MELPFINEDPNVLTALNILILNFESKTKEFKTFSKQIKLHHILISTSPVKCLRLVQLLLNSILCIRLKSWLIDLELPFRFKI